MFSKLALLSAVLGALQVSAYTYPAFTGNLLIQREFNMSWRSSSELKTLHLRPIAGANTAKCLQAANSNGAPVVLATCTGSASQKWKFGPQGAISLYGGTKCMDMSAIYPFKFIVVGLNPVHHSASGVNADGTKVQVWDCSSTNPNQRFDYTKWGDNQ